MGRATDVTILRMAIAVLGALWPLMSPFLALRPPPAQWPRHFSKCAAVPWSLSDIIGLLLDSRESGNYVLLLGY